jgi:FAD/FMN-containing dehydrogenase
VLPDGAIWHGLRRLRKDNTGYDLRNLLIGAEGTLGIITAAALRLFPRPAREGAALMVVPNPVAALELLALTGEVAGGALTAFELISGMGLRFLAETLPDLRQPFADAPDWSVLIDLGTEADRAPETVLETIFARASETGLVSDGLISASIAQRAHFWHVRESIPEANRRTGAILSNDISLPLGLVPVFIVKATAEIGRMGPYRINCFGHLGDGNLHFNVFPEKGVSRSTHAAAREPLLRLINELVAAHEGSFSAEHGVGRAKVGELERYADPTKLAAMRAIKEALDPAGIMNPGAVLTA